MARLLAYVTGLVNQELLLQVEYLAPENRPRRFRAMLDQWLTTIRAIWPDCPADVSADGNSLVLRNASAVQSKSVSPFGP